MITLQFTGQITDIMPVEQFNAGFKKRIFWIKADEANVYQLETWNDDVDLPNKFKDGRPSTFHVEIRGKRWSKNGREGVINTLRCVGITRPFREPENEPDRLQDPADDLPF